MFANTLNLDTLGTFTRVREQNDASTYLQLDAPVGTAKQLRIAHQSAGTDKSKRPLTRHLVSLITTSTHPTLGTEQTDVQMNCTVVLPTAAPATVLTTYIGSAYKLLVAQSYTVVNTAPAGLVSGQGFVVGEI